MPHEKDLLVCTGNAHDNTGTPTDLCASPSSNAIMNLTGIALIGIKHRKALLIPQRIACICCFHRGSSVPPLREDDCCNTRSKFQSHFSTTETEKNKHHHGRISGVITKRYEFLSRHERFLVK